MVVTLVIGIFGIVAIWFLKKQIKKKIDRYMDNPDFRAKVVQTLCEYKQN
jgi:uncharacterized protein YneF (UPF0154 family)